MSNNLGEENVHGVSFSNTDNEDGLLESDAVVSPETELETVVEPEEPQLEPVEATRSVPPEPEPVKPESKTATFDDQTLNRMAWHYRKVNRAKMTIDQAKEVLKSDPEVIEEYKKLYELGKFK